VAEIGHHVPGRTRQLGKARGPIAVWLLCLVTFGIYYLVWWYKINRELRDFDPSIEVSPATSVVAITIGSLIVVPPIVSTLNTGSRISQAQQEVGLRTCSPVVGLLLWFAFGLNTVYYQDNLNNLWEHVRRFEQ